ncbi:hypothetical protein [Paraburkholderia adhaesiva]|uniref:hypothetical protein n=1 Tax=Paraburkholderia adhaesiva TaxID=2883244 RepID=UPI001F278FE8|nr:hypothetical protein [Paraburkholderia adhaesiva]
MREFHNKTVQEVAACTCDRCGRRMTPDGHDGEWDEMVSVDARGGYWSVFGDGAYIRLDLCQHCVRETLGAWLRVTQPDHEDLRRLMARIPVWAQPAEDQGEHRQVQQKELKSILQSAAGSEAGSIESMYAASAAGAGNAGVGEPCADSGGPAPEFHWNYRVMEFDGGGETRREFREVYYRNGRPEGYSSVAASPVWDADAGGEAARRTLERMREALERPVLRPEDFRNPDNTESPRRDDWQD